MTDAFNDEFVTEEQLERLLKLKPGSLRQRRHRSALDIPVARIGRTIRYHWPTVKKHLMPDSVIDNNTAPVAPKRVGRKRIGWDINHTPPARQYTQ